MMKRFLTMTIALFLIAGMGVNAQTTLKVNTFKIGIGEKKTVTLNLDNEGFAGAAFVCDVYLPDGVVIETDEQGDYDISYNVDGGRVVNSESFVIASRLQDDGAVRIVCFPTDAQAFNGTSGAVVNIPLAASSTISKGTVEVKIAGQEIVNATGLSAVNPDAYIGSMLAVIIGDVNDDDAVNVADLVGVSNFMAGTSSIPEIIADVNDDAAVNVADMISISNIMANN